MNKESGYKDLRSGIRQNCDEKLTISYQYYDDYEALKRFLSEVSKYKEKNIPVKIQIVDDCSKNFPLDNYIDCLVNLNIKAYRIVDDIAWNQAGARNLNAYLCDTKWNIFTDMDHIFNFEMLTLLLEKKKAHFFSSANLYTFARRDTSGKKLTPHVNTYMINNNVFRHLGGIDEDFVGQYGFEDKFFIENAKILGINKIEVSSIETELFTGKSGNQQQEILRDRNRNENLYKAKMDQALFRSFLNLRFSYYKLC